MKLSPVHAAPATDYPSRHDVFARVGGWLRKAATAAVASSALVFGACYGATPLGPGGDPGDPGDPTDPRVITADEPPGPFADVIVAEAGVAMAPSFACSETRPDPMPYEAQGWGYFEGPLCGELTGWAVHEVVEGAAGRYRLSLSAADDVAQVALLDPGGAEVAVVDGSAPEAEVDLTTGIWTLAATALDPVGHPSDWIAVNLDRID